MNQIEFEDLKERLNAALSEEDFLFAQLEHINPQDKPWLMEKIQEARERRRLAVEEIDKAIRPELYPDEE